MEEIDHLKKDMEFLIRERQLDTEDEGQLSERSHTNGKST